MSRKLATIQIIKELLPIPEADAIELATFENICWKCVVKKGEFQKGDKAVYFEIDSLLPLIPEFEFLANKGTRKTLLEDGTVVEGYRLRTIKLRGQISQGLALPLTTFLIVSENETAEESEDVSELLNIHKYEASISPQLAGQVKGNFPVFIPKTSEERIQTYWGIVQKYKDLEWYAAVKYDGMSVTYMKHEGEFGVCSRNLQLLETEGNSLWKMADMLNLKNKLPEGFAVQGELFGEGINKNPHKIKGVDFRVFNVYNIKEGKFLDYEDAENFVNDVHLSFVETIEINNSYKINLQDKTLEDFLQMADDTKLEGLVFRPLKEVSDLRFGRVSFKVISNNYLLKEKE